MFDVREFDDGNRAFNAWLTEGPPSRDSSDNESARKRRKLTKAADLDSEDSDEDMIQVISEKYGRGMRERPFSFGAGGRSSRSRGNTHHVQLSGSEFETEDEDDKRRSGRRNKKKNYADPQYDSFDEEYGYGEDEDDTPVVSKPKPQKKNIKFRKFEEGDEFVKFHMQTCATCGEGKEKAQMIYCQGCSLAYHHQCLGPTKQSKHRVTRIGEDEWVLQCRRCINEHLAKDPGGARFDKCVTCKEEGPACHAFEQKPQPESATNSPVPEEIKPELINNVDNVLFRCMECHRGFHFHHLPYSTSDVEDDDTDADGNKMTDKQIALDRMEIYSSREEQAWSCPECIAVPSKIESIVAWRPIGDDIDKTAEYELDQFAEDEKEYLMKYEKYSYFQVKWVPGGWVYGYLRPTMMSAFARKDPTPKYSTDDAFPRSFITVELILDVSFKEADPYPQDVHKDVQLERIDTISRAFVKFQGLDYDQSEYTKK